MKTAFLKRHEGGAGKWIYLGYANAWEAAGYSVQFFSDISEIKNADIVMIVDDDINSEMKFLKLFDNSDRILFHAKPTNFPAPYNTHPNYISQMPPSVRGLVNMSPNFIPWSFGETGTSYMKDWAAPLYLPLAFDDVAYQQREGHSYDVAYIGGWANNGFNTKAARIKSFLGALRDLPNLGFFVNKNLTHEEEEIVLSNCKVSLNVHDTYQVELGLDINERTFKSIGLGSGWHISDRVRAGENLNLPATKWVDNPEEMRQTVMRLLESGEEPPSGREAFLRDHTYKARVTRILERIEHDAKKLWK